MPDYFEPWEGTYLRLAQDQQALDSPSFPCNLSRAPDGSPGQLFPHWRQKKVVLWGCRASQAGHKFSMGLVPNSMDPETANSTPAGQGSNKD